MSKVVVITGATSGMGKTTALYLSSKGYCVYAGYRDENKKNELLNVAKEQNLVINTVLIDVTKTQTIKDAFKVVMAKENKIDVLLNNAGYGLLASLEEGNDEEIFNQFDVNVFGLIKSCREVLPYMRSKNDGVIINISSFLGKMGLPLLSHYNASKYAVEGITDSLRYETLPFGIRVHSIQSGLFGTNFVKSGLVASALTTSADSPYKDIVAHLAPIVAKAINEGPDPIAIAKAVESIIENKNSPISIPVGVEAETFVPMEKSMTNEEFESKVKETFGI